MKCFAVTCRNDFHGSKGERQPYSKHRFPADLGQRMEWFRAISRAENREIDIDAVNLKTNCLCSNHFSVSDFYVVNGRNRLKSDACPRFFGDEAVRNGEWVQQAKLKYPRCEVPAPNIPNPIRVKECAQAAQEKTRELIESVLGCTGGTFADESPLPDSTVFRLEKFPRVCRLCLKPEESLTDVIISLDATDDALDGVSIGEFISDILPTGETWDQDHQRFLPNSVCLPCLELLRFFARYRSKVTTVHLFMNSLIELKRHNSEPIVDLFSTRSDLVHPVIKDLGLSRLDDFSVQDLLDEFPRYDLASLEGFAVKEPEEVQEQNQHEKFTQDMIYAEECTTEELMELTNDNPDLVVTDSSDSYPILKKKKPRSTSQKYGGTKLKQPLQCSKCSFSTYYRLNFQTHQKRHEKPKVREYPCKEPGCSEVFKTNREYRSHVPVAHKLLICDTCGLRWPTKTALNEHMSRHRMQLQHVCPYCKRGHNTKSDLRSHISRKHLIKDSYRCETCGMTFQRKSVRDEHVARHSKTYDFPCTLCDKKFNLKRKLKRHMSVVHERVRFPCSYCSFDCDHTYKLNNHIESVHGIQVRFVCDICVQTFNSQDKLDGHRARHDNPHELECGTCLTAVVSEELLANHLCITYREDYVCCGRDLRYHLMYNKHMLTKHGLKTNARVKPIPGLLMGQMRAQRKRVETCPKCEQVFATRTQKKQHMEICAVVEERNGGVANPVTADVPMV